MKNILKYLLLSLPLLIAGCTKDSDADNGGRIITTRAVTDVFYNEVLARADLENPRNIVETGFLVSPTPGVDPRTALTFVSQWSEGKQFLAYIDNLQQRTDYYIKAYALDSRGTYHYGLELLFRTSNTRIEYVTMGQVDPPYDPASLLGRSVTFFGMVTDLGGSPQVVSEYGAIYWPKSNPSLRDTVSIAVTKDDAPIAVNTRFSIPITKLDPNTEYEVQVYARNARKPQYLPPVEIKTEPVFLPEIEFGPGGIIAVTPTFATAQFKVTSNGGDTEFKYGVYYWSDPSAKKKEYAEGIDAGGNFVVTIQGLSASTGYNMQGFVENVAGEGVTPDERSFTTLPLGKPMVEPVTASVSDLGLTTAVLRASVASNGGAEITECGIRYGTSPESLTLTAISSDYNPGSGNFSASITGLDKGNKTYYFTAFATNSYGEGVGTQVLSFRTGIEGELKWTQSGTSIVASPTERRVYFELDPIDVTIDDLLAGASNPAKLYFLDRNLGANERFPDCATDVTPEYWGRYVGDYYRWGMKAPNLIHSEASAAGFISGNNNAMLQVGWSTDPVPTDNVWPAANNPCPDGYHVPSVFEWQAFSKAVAAARPATNGNFQDVYDFIYLGKTGFRTTNGTMNNQSTIYSNTNVNITTLGAFLWSSTPLRARPVENNVTFPQIGNPGSTVNFSTFLSSNVATESYHFCVSTDAWIFPRVGNPYMLDLTAIRLNPAPVAPADAYKSEIYYDDWRQYGIWTRGGGCGLPVRCVRTEVL